MTAEPPRYIRVDQIAEKTIRHSWSDWDPFETLGDADPETVERLDKVSNRGITAFAIGCSEWVVYRPGMLTSDDTPSNYLEAFWAYVMGVTEAQPPETDDEDWKGPIRGPINFALMMTLNTIICSEPEDGVPSTYAGLAARVALHVLSDERAFLDWQRSVLERLVRYFPRRTEDPDGPSVPREVLDPTVDLDTENVGRLIREFLSRLDPRRNPFLPDSL